MTLRVAATANRMRMSERPKFLKRRQGRLKGRKHNHKKTGQEKIKQAKPAAAGERWHQNTNAEAGHITRTRTKKNRKVKSWPSG